MKPDGVTTETMEPTDAAATAELALSQDNATEQTSPHAQEVANEPPLAAVAPNKADGKQVAAEPKVKPNAAAAKSQPKAKSAANSRPGTSNDVKSSNSVSSAAAKKMTSTTAAAKTAGAVPKRPVGASAVSNTARNQTRVPDRKPVGPSRTTTVASATATNGAKPAPVNGVPKKKPAAETVNASRPKTTAATTRPTASTASKPSTSASAKPVGAAASRTTRPATAPAATARPASSASRPTTAAAKTSTTATAKSAAASKVTVAPSTGRTTAAPPTGRTTAAPSPGRTTAAQPPRTTTTNAAAARKDVGRLPGASVAKKPTTATSTASKKPEPSKPMATAKVNSVSKLSAAPKPSEPKTPQSKTSQPAKPAATKTSAARLPQTSKPPFGRTPPASPVSKPASSNSSQSKRGTKPTQTVLPLPAVKKTKGTNAANAAVDAQPGAAAAAVAAAAVAAAAVAAAAVAAVAAVTPVLAETEAEAAEVLPEGLPPAVPAPEEVTPPVSVEVVPQETEQSHAAAPSPTQSPIERDATKTSPTEQHPENSALSPSNEEPIPAPVEPAQSLASPTEEPACGQPDDLLTGQTPSTSTALPTAATNPILQIVPPTNLNEEEDEEEREGSQLVSVSEMSGTTQPTEESRPGSAGPVGGAAWRASSALFSELDSEDVSGSQQGASELSAPGVLEGTESMDDLGDGSLKGAIDMEGASAGSPDFEKVPDIPVNDFEEDEDEDDDDNDRVCDMDVGSERTDDLQRLRHDNDVDDEEDEDVEMASEGVTESGLESYGNADEDDFAEDERLDNLNRVAQPPPPPLLPSAPAAQWDQPNPFADHWAEPVQPQQVPESVDQIAGAAAASPVADAWQADSETPTQTPAQAWPVLGATPFVVETEESEERLPVNDEPENAEARLYVDQSGPAQMQTLAPAPASAPGMSLSSTLSSGTSTPEELCDYNQENKVQPEDVHAPVLSPQPDPDVHLDRVSEDVEEEAETLPADEVLGGPATAPTSNPSSSSVTEDEASDTEGEAQLEDSLEVPALNNCTFEIQTSAQRCLSTVEEGDEAVTESTCAGEDTTPPSATSLASYGFDTTASNSNAQSTGESCIKSPGVFSLEELPEEAKEPCLTPQPNTPPHLAEQQYIECRKQDAELELGEVPGSDETLDPSPSLNSSQKPEENPDDIQPPYYSICEKSENSLAGFTALLQPHRRDHPAHPRTYCDIVKPLGGASVAPPKLTCADLPPRSLGRHALSPQLRRLEQHQRQLLELQHRREQQSRPLEEAEQERKRREEEEQRRKKEEAEEEIKRNKEEEERRLREEEEETARRKTEEDLKQRRELELQLQQQQEELKQRQQIMQWQQELRQSSQGQTVLLSPSSGLCTIYEALENSEDETEDNEERRDELHSLEEKKLPEEPGDDSERVTPNKENHEDARLSTEDCPPQPEPTETPSSPSQDGNSCSPWSPESPERPPPLDLDWGMKVDIVQQLINQTLMLNGDGCSSLLLMPGGAGGTLSPLESSLWPSLLPPLTPPSATVTSVSSFSPEATGSSPQGEWTVVELETHH